MAAKKKSGRLALRMDAAIHRRVIKTAKALGMDMNGLLNLTVRTAIPQYELLAQANQAREPERTKVFWRLILAYIQTLDSVMAEAALIARALEHPAGKAAVARLLDEMAKFTETIADTLSQPADDDQPQQPENERGKS